MIKYNLKCKNKHEFESWFLDSKEFEKLKSKKMKLLLNNKGPKNGPLNFYQSSSQSSSPSDSRYSASSANHCTYSSIV